MSATVKISQFSIVFLVLLFMQNPPVAATPGDENWDSQFGVPGANGWISAIAVIGNDVYFAGGFSQIGGVNTTGIARWDGTQWHPLGGGLNGGVTSLLVSGADLYVAGGFTQAGGLAATNTAKWDGTNWSSLGAVGSPIPRALAVVENSIYVGGQFISAGGVGAINIAKWDGTNWSALGNGVGRPCQGIIGPPYECGSVGSLAVIGNTLYVGGSFRSANGLDVNNIVAWDGTKWSALGSGLRRIDGPNVPNNPNGDVRAMLSRGSELYAGGDFLLAGVVSATNVARWDGTNWSPLGEGLGGYEVDALAFSGTDLYAGGYPSVAGWDGTNWSSLGSGIGRDDGLVGSVYGLASNGTELFVGGSFTTAGGKPSSYIALWHIPHALSASRSQNALTLSWPATGTNFVLEATDSVPGTNWSEISQPPIVHDTQCVVTNAISGGQKFFRLRRR